MPRKWRVSHRRGKEHLADYDKAKSDILEYVKSRTDERQLVGHTIRLLYHRVGRTKIDPFGTNVPPERFRDHLNIIANRIDKGIVAREGVDSTARIRVEIHFDDAYSEIAPMVRACHDHGLAVRIFATGYSFGAERVMPGDEFLSYLNHDFGTTTAASRRAANGAAEKLPADGTRADEWHRFFCDLWRDDPDQAKVILDQVRASSDDRPPLESVVMSPAELQGLSREGCLVGAHGYVHTRLSGRSADFVAADTDRITELVAEVDAVGATHFAFPYGSDSDIDATAVATLRRAGCTTLYSTLGRDVEIGGAPILGRFQVGNLDGLNFAECLDRCISTLLVDDGLDSLGSNHFLHDVVDVLEDTGW